MTSNHLTLERLSLINQLVKSMCQEGFPAPDQLAQLDATNFAALRCISHQINESELRAIIYDRLFPMQREPEAA